MDAFPKNHGTRLAIFATVRFILKCARPSERRSCVDKGNASSHLLPDGNGNATASINSPYNPSAAEVLPDGRYGFLILN